MRKIVLSTAVLSALVVANSVQLEDINVETSIPTEVMADVSGEDIKSADLGEALFKESSSVSLMRRSGIANDILVRGQKKDNISVTIDGAKVHGACPNRMDPPISHVLTNNVESVEVSEGPFNVEDFGVLSADVKVKTVEPKEGFSGEVNVGFGSFDYKKQSLSVKGGDEKVKYIISASKESGGQYEDGNGNDFNEQMIATGVASDKLYSNTSLDAFEKETFMSKVFINLSENQDLKLSYTANRSDNILYPSTGMDAIYDDSNIYNVEYTAKELGEHLKEISAQVYKSEVDHPMSNENRSAMMTMINALTTEVKGAKVKEKLVYGKHTITAGIDHSTRNWNGFYNNDTSKPSINDVDTKNSALFINDKVKVDKYLLEMGLRYDKTTVKSVDNVVDNKYNELNGYVLGTYNKDENTKYYVGFGKSSRVPDAKELYMKNMGKLPDGTPYYVTSGTPTLKNPVNYELDMGLEKHYENSSVKAKMFYSDIKDYIAYQRVAANTVNKYENVDVTIYGIDLSGTYIATDVMYFDYGMAYQRGKKDNPLSGQTGTNLADIPPLKVNVAANYDYGSNTMLKAEVIAANSWNNFDSENGEQKLDSYAVLNLRATKEYQNNVELIVGVDNVFDTTYSVSNTYNELNLLSGGDVMLMNEPGRYFYTNLRYKF